MLDRKRWIWAISVVLLAGLGGLLKAAPPLTLIQDTLYKADGSRFNGTAFIYWRTFEASDTSNIPRQSIALNIVNGVVRVQLVPTTNASTGAYYEVRYNSNGRVQFTEYWSVPPSAVTLRLRDIRIAAPAGASDVTPPVNTSMGITDVAGLREELDARPTKGIGYSVSRTVAIDSTGALISVLGSPSDCVHVDGSSGTCGGSGSSSGPSITFVEGESPAGGKDGTNATFTLSQAPSPASSLLLYRNGILQTQGLDYAVADTTVTMAVASIPSASDSLVASYRVTIDTGSLNFSDAEHPAGSIDSSNTVFTLQNTPNPATSLAVYRNGFLQQPGIDYSLTGSTITFLVSSIPQAGDSLQVYYRF